MRTAAVSITLAAIATLALAPVATAGDGAIAWMDNYEAALAQSKQTGRPMMIKFFATW